MTSAICLPQATAPPYRVKLTGTTLVTATLPPQDSSVTSLLHCRGVTSLSWYHRLDARDRALFARWVTGQDARRSVVQCWRTLTHVGGATATLVLTLLPMLVCAPGSALALAGRQGFFILAFSHALVQLVKRTVSRPRPSLGVGCSILAAEPDRFSFPSGHAAAAMSVAMGYAMVFPNLAVPLVLLAAAVGASRVYLGVHYPGDVLVGQLLALMVGVAMVSM